METNLKIPSKNEILLNSLFLFYKEGTNMETIIPIINGQSNISLRVLDWFVTNYSKKNNIIYNIEKEGKAPILFNVFLDYRLQLKAYSKKYFDPFCRKNRIIFYYQDKIAIKTTVGQLNFFRWAIKNNIIIYVINHLHNIVIDMNTIYKERRNIDSNSTNSNSTNSNDNLESEIISDDINSNSSNSPINISNDSLNDHQNEYYEDRRQRRKQLSKSATKTLNKINTEIILYFD
jgi:hypothetical protein